MINNLNKIRTEKGYSLGGLSKSCGVGKTTIFDLENGREPGLSTAYKICKSLKVPLREIWPDGIEVILRKN